MSWVILGAGLVIWWLAHLFKRIAPQLRAAVGNTGKSAIAIALLLAVVLMVLGYRETPVIVVWSPPAFLITVNNVLMMIAVYFYTPAAKYGVVISGVRHPMLLGFKTWALAHLLVNGDLASIVLFSALLFWAVAEMVVINRAEPDWDKASAASRRRSLGNDALFMVASGVIVAALGYVHYWLGVWPFPS
ncbi:MAG: NnrU family protein [Aestuariivita sp.]|nr:NnrU family protein [Aestuariivita sp.]MCY4345488.1 NnrU family protein [Aestuariivita sp.]